MGSRAAEREAFARIDETCPKVDDIMERAIDGIKEQTMALRAALVEAIDDLFVEQSRVEELETEVETLKARIDELEAELRETA